MKLTSKGRYAVMAMADLAKNEDMEILEDRLDALNPGAPRERVVMGDIAPKKLFDTGLYDPKTKSIDVRRWLREEAYKP